MAHRSLFALVPCALPALLHAQEALVEVPPGREVQQYKVLTPGVADRWELDAAAGEFLHCVVESSEFDPVLELVDADGERLGSDDGEGTRSELQRFAPAEGRFVLRVTGYEGRSGGNYRFWLLRYRTEPLAMDAAAEHVFGPEQWWHFRVPATRGDVFVPRVPYGGTLTAVLDTSQRRLPEWHGGYTARDDGDVLLRVEGAPGHRFCVDVQLARIVALPADGSLDAELPEGGMRVVRHRFEPGACTLELDTPDHDLAVGFRETAPSRVPRFAWTGHLEKNGRRRQWLLVHEAMDAELVLRNHGGPACCRGRFVPVSDRLAFGAPRDAVLPLGGGSVFEFDASPGQLVRIELESAAFDGCFDVWTPDGGVYRFDDVRRIDLNPAHTFLVQQRGVHRVLVYGPAGAGSGPFTICVRDVPVPDLAVGEPMPVAVRGGDVFVHLACIAGQELWLSVQSCAFDAALAVQDPNGRQVAVIEGGGIGGDVLNGIVAETPGVHTLQVMSRRGSGDGVLRAILP